jgi:hypothetical protein
MKKIVLCLVLIFSMMIVMASCSDKKDNNYNSPNNEQSGDSIVTPEEPLPTPPIPGGGNKPGNITTSFEPPKDGAYYAGNLKYETYTYYYFDGTRYYYSSKVAGSDMQKTIQFGNFSIIQGELYLDKYQVDEITGEEVFVETVKYSYTSNSDGSLTINGIKYSPFKYENPFETNDNGGAMR